MRGLFLTLVVAVASLGWTAATPSVAEARDGPAFYSSTTPVRWYRGGSRWRGYSHYYYPRSYGYYGGYYNPGYSYYYSPGYNYSYYYNPGYYSPGYYSPGYYNPGYSNYYNPGYYPGGSYYYYRGY